MKTNILSNSLRLAVIASISSGIALAGSPDSIESTPTIQTPPSTESDWEFRIEPFIWAPALDGTVGVLGRTTDIDFSLSDLFSSSSAGNASYDVDMLFAIQVEARKGRWGIIADATYLDLDITGTPPTPRHLSADVDFTELLGNLLVTYRLTDNSPTGFLDLYSGARVNSLSLDISAQANRIIFPGQAAFDDSHTETWVDPVIGLRGQWNFAEKFFLAGKADIGGFGVSSDLLWSAEATLGYQFTPGFNTEIGYSYYNTDYEDGGFNYDVAMGGFFIGFNITL